MASAWRDGVRKHRGGAGGRLGDEQGRRWGRKLGQGSEGQGPSLRDKHEGTR